MINQRINRELFFYNPVYKSLLKKKNSIMQAAEIARQTHREKGMNLGPVLNIKEFNSTVTYKAKRKQIKFRQLWKAIA